VTHALGLTVKDLFFDAPSTDPRQRWEAMRQRAQAQTVRQAAHEAEGRRIDALREAEYLVLTAQRLSIDAWTDDQLAPALDRVGHAWQLLEEEGLLNA
jgi:hypothetical protein